MKNRKKDMWILVGLLLPFYVGVAQHSINTSGGDATGSNGYISWSVGQFAYLQHTGDGGSVSEGVQQPYEISIVTGLDKSIRLSMQTIPNPVRDVLYLKCDDMQLDDMQYQVVDMHGKVVLKDRVLHQENPIDMNTLIPGTYFLKISQQQHEVKMFKIVKN